MCSPVTAKASQCVERPIREDYYAAKRAGRKGPLGPISVRGGAGLAGREWGSHEIVGERGGGERLQALGAVPAGRRGQLGRQRGGGRWLFSGDV